MVRREIGDNVRQGTARRGGVIDVLTSFPWSRLIQLENLRNLDSRALPATSGGREKRLGQDSNPACVREASASSVRLGRPKMSPRRRPSTLWLVE